MQKHSLLGITGEQTGMGQAAEAGSPVWPGLWEEQKALPAGQRGPRKLRCQGSEQRHLPAASESHWSSADDRQEQIRKHPQSSPSVRQNVIPPGREGIANPQQISKKKRQI